QLVRADHCAGPLRDGLIDSGSPLFGEVEQVAGALVGAQQGRDSGPQGMVVAACPVQERRTLGGADLHRLREQRFFRQTWLIHRSSSPAGELRAHVSFVIQCAAARKKRPRIWKKLSGGPWDSGGGTRGLLHFAP